MPNLQVHNTTNASLHSNVLSKVKKTFPTRERRRVNLSGEIGFTTQKRVKKDNKFLGKKKLCNNEKG
jgi:hypothetical protein